MKVNSRACDSARRPRVRQDVARRVRRARRQRTSLGGSPGIAGGFTSRIDSQGPDCFEETATFVDNIGVDVAHFSILTPYPGTATYARMLGDGFASQNFDWERYGTCTPRVYAARRRMTADPSSKTASRRPPTGPSSGPERPVGRLPRRQGSGEAGPLALAAANHNYATRYKHPHSPPATVTRPTPTTSRACWRPVPPRPGGPQRGLLGGGRPHRQEISRARPSEDGPAGRQ